MCVIAIQTGRAEFWGERMEDRKPTTVRKSKTVVHVVTKTVTKVVKKPYIHPLTPRRWRQL
jgi:hypothetical protein